jgi:short-subunit dehydrogenase
MVKRRRGHIINVASLAAITPMVGIATYVATKHAVLGYSDSVRLELRGTGVAVSTMMPTLTNTAMVDGVPSLPGFRNAEPQDIAAGIVSLIDRPKPHLGVTRSAWVLTTVMQRFMPQRINETVRRALRADGLFAEAADKQERREYEDRARHS